MTAATGNTQGSPAAAEFDQIFEPAWSRLLYPLAVAIALFHLYIALSAEFAQLTRNALHFAGFALMGSLVYPLRRGAPARWHDLALGILVAIAAVYLAFAEDAIYERGVRLSTLDWTAGLVLILGGLELARRVAGPVIPVMILLALSYIVFWGQYVPGVFRFSGLSPETVMFRSIYGDDAFFGTIAQISATYVVLFIIFGAFLLRSGAGDFVIDLSRALAGRMVGGPGMVAVIASALTGTISGSPVANTASTGVITIPLMKRAGFEPKFAAGVEAAASTGGQLMPPIMGAGAFVMAAYTQISYEVIVTVALLPALLYFASVLFFVRIEARRLALQPMGADGPSLWEAVRRGGASFLIPIAIVITMLVMGFTPTYAAAVGIGSVIVASWLTEHPMGPRAILDALAMGARNMIMTAILLCVVGLIVNVIATAGIGNTFSLMIDQWAGGNLLIAIVLIGLASLVLGMGLPVTAAYIVVATLSAPALAGMIQNGVLADIMAAGNLPEEAMAFFMLGAPEAIAQLAGPMSRADAAALIATLPLEIVGPLRDMVIPPAAATTALLSAHMIIFWLSQDSNVTPPVCLAAFTAAAIAKTPPMATGVASWRLAKGLYIVPVLFAYTPFLSGNWGDALEVFGFAIVGIYGIAAAMQGWMENRLGWPLRIATAIAGVACIWPASLAVDIAGVAALAIIFALNLRFGEKASPAAA